MHKRMFTLALVVGALSSVGSAQQGSPIVISAAMAITGGNASLGAIQEKAFKLFEKKLNAAGGIAGRPVKFNLYDTASDPQKAVLNVRKGITEDRAVGIICCTTTPESLAVSPTAIGAKAPLISMAASASIVEPVKEKFWIFKTPPPDRIMVKATVDRMKKLGFKRVAFLSFSDAYGESGLKEFERFAPAAGIEIVAREKFARADNDTSAQAARIVGAKPDAVFVFAIPPGAVTAHKSLVGAGYKGKIYQSYGVTNPSFLSLGGADVNGTEIVGLGIVVYDQLGRVANKSTIDDFVKAYRAEYGGESPTSFAAHAWDAALIMTDAVRRTLARGVSPDNLPAFRSELRNQIEGTKNLRGVAGIFNMSAADHTGLGPSAANLIFVQNGKFIPGK